MRTLAAALAVWLCAAGAASAADAPHDDAYLAGYATAVIERDLGLKVVSVEVHAGVARVAVRDLADQPADRIREALLRIEGIERVEVSEAEAGAAPSPATAEPEPVPAPAPTAEPAGGPEPEPAFELLPRVELFAPLIADPRQPHFSVSYLWYLDDPQLDHVGSATLGETFALLGGALFGGRWEIGLLGGVFSIFDLDAPSKDLINTDFWVGPTISVKRDGWSSQLRIYHQSSHLGDEFLLARPGFNRVNLSYEGADLLISDDPWSWLRIYGGGGSIFASDTHLAPLSAQGGVELHSPVAFLGGAVRPIAGFDYASRQENDWHEELSTVAGIQIENPALSKLHVQILASWYKGNSRNGQFFGRRIESLGLGIHLHYF